jgi:hypothetical protein
MVLQTTAVARQWLSSDHVVTPTDTNATVALLYAVRARFVISKTSFKVCRTFQRRGQKAPRAVRQENMVMIPVGLETKNHCAGEGQHNLITL